MLRTPTPPKFQARAHRRVLTRPIASAEAQVPATAVFAALSDRGRVEGSLLLEHADAAVGTHLRARLFPRPLLRLTAGGERVTVRALTPRGLPLLAALQTSPTLVNVELREAELNARVARPTVVPGDDRGRLLAPSVLDVIRAVVGLVQVEAVGGDAGGGPPVALHGALGYELVDAFEDLPPRGPAALDEQDVDLCLSVDGIEIDHTAGTVTAVARALSGPGYSHAAEERDAQRRLARQLEASRDAAASDTPQPDLPQPGPVELEGFEDAETYKRGVDRILEHVRAGDVFQAVLSRELRARSDEPPFDVYRRLRELSPAPYLFHLNLAEGALLGASPEACVRVAEGRVGLMPIAGTAPRGRVAGGALDHELDGRLGLSLASDPKELAEHAMLVDLARNDLARIAVPGTRRVTGPVVERFSHVQHLVSRVTAELDPAFDALDAYRACANMGTVTGAPKLRAIELIRRLEPTARGTYGGAVCVLTADGELDSCLVIRSLRWSQGVYRARVGAGVVYDSRPERELAETEHKAESVLRALGALEEVAS